MRTIWTLLSVLIFSASALYATESETKAEVNEVQVPEQEEASTQEKDFQKRWKGTSVNFLGTLIGTTEGNKAFSMFGVDNTYFEGTANLVLSKNGEAHFILKATPSKKATSEGRGRVIQITDFCNTINNDLTGKWSIDGNKVLIDGKDRGLTIAPDNLSISYSGMLGSKMIKQK